MAETPGSYDLFRGLLGGDQDQQDQGFPLSLLLALMPSQQMNPLQQLGSALAGFASGTQGQPNPVLQQFQQTQEQNTRSRLAVAGVLQSVQRERRLKTEGQARMFESLASSSIPEIRTYGVKGILGIMERQGTPVPRLGGDLLRGPLKLDKIPGIAKLIEAGWDDASIQAVEPEYMPAYREDFLKILSTPQNRAMFNIPTKEKISADLRDIEAKNFQAMLDTHAPELHGNLDIKPFVILAARKIPPLGREYWQLSLAERDRALGAGAQALAEKQGALAAEKVYQTVTARLDATRDAPGSAKDYFNANPPYQPLSGTTTQSTALALEAVGGAAKIPGKADQQSLKYVNQLKKALDEYRDAIVSLPEYFPVETGNTIKDLGAVANAATKFHLGGAARTDPRTVPLTAIKRHVVNLARISGTGARLSNYVAELESKSGGFEVTATRGVKIGLANQVETFLNSQLEAMGLKPLPKWTPGHIARLKSGKVVRILPDGTQYVIGLGE